MLIGQALVMIVAPLVVYIFFLVPNLISWSCRKQATVARSSTELEYKALTNSASNIQWLQSLLQELGVPKQKPLVFWFDNIDATYLSSNLVYHARMKHVEIDFHFVRDMVTKRTLEVRFISSGVELANIFIKPLSSAWFAYLRSKLNIVPLPLTLKGRVKDKSKAQQQDIDHTV
jgi:hypothetical protein